LKCGVISDDHVTANLLPRVQCSVHILMPPYRLSSYGRRAFSVAGPTTWNSLPKQFRDPVHTTSEFACLLKTFIFSEY